MCRVSLPAFLAITLALLSADRACAVDVPVSVLDQKTGKPVSDAVVWFVPLDGTVPPHTAGPAPAVADIQQRGQEFAPFVTVVQTGGAVRLPNKDTVEHHVYSESAPKRFQFPLYAPGKAETVTFDKPGVVALGCNIHDWMIAYVVVVDSPWHARTDAEGRAVVGAPPGRYRAELWHFRLGRIESREVVVAAAAAVAPVAFEVTLKPDRRIRRSGEAGKAGYR